MAVPCARMAGRRRAECKECGGSSMCPHGRRRAQCKECFAAAAEGEVATVKAAKVVAMALEDVTADARCLAKRDGLGRVRKYWRKL